MPHHRTHLIQLAFILAFILTLPGLHPNSVSASRVPQSADVSWKEARESNGIVYFLYTTNPSSIKRYDLAAESWLPELFFNYELSTFDVDEDGLYVATYTNVYHFDLDGADDTDLYGMDENRIISLKTDDDLLLVHSRDYNYGNFISLNKKTGAQLSFFSSMYEILSEMIIAQFRGLLIGMISVSSPSDIIEISYGDDGSFGSIFHFPYHGDYPVGAS